MLVFGDHHDRIAPTAKLEELGSRLDRVHRMQPGIARHAALVNAFVEAGRLHQGLADHDFHIAGWDRRSVAADRIGAFVHDLAVAVLHSALGSPDLLPHVPALSAGQFPEEVTVKVAEGYAFYAVYPEAFAEAAGRLELVAPPRVIGIRSIGSSLAAIVAAALGA
ncbi:MAG: hypothetical protein ACJ8EY_03460, partial [Sphingomicrobium sp.]